MLADQGDVATSTGASDAVAWGKIIVGVVFLPLAVRQWRSQPVPGSEPTMPTWMAGIDAFSPAEAVALGVLLASVNLKTLLRTLAAAPPDSCSRDDVASAGIGARCG